MPASRHQDHTTSPSASAPFVNGAISVHRIPTRVDDVGQRPSVGQDGQLVELICPTGKAEYFCAQDWTGRIALIRFNNLAFGRNGPGAAQTRSPDGAQRNPGPVPLLFPDFASLDPGYVRRKAVPSSAKILPWQRRMTN